MEVVSTGYCEKVGSQETPLRKSEWEIKQSWLAMRICEVVVVVVVGSIACG